MLGHYELRELQSARARAHSAEAHAARLHRELRDAVIAGFDAQARIRALEAQLAQAARGNAAGELAAEQRGREQAQADARREAVRAATDIAGRDSELRQLRARLRQLEGALRRALPDGMLTGDDCRDALDAADSAGAAAR